MYDTRFRQWNESKVLKKAEKEMELERLSAMADPDKQYLLARIDPKKLQKIMRHVQLKHRERARLAVSPHRAPVSPDKLHFCRSRASSSDDEDVRSNAVSSVDATSRRGSMSHFLSGSECSSRDSSEDVEYSIETPGASQLALTPQSGNTSSSPLLGPLSPRSALYFNPQDRNVQKILSIVNTSLSHATERFWQDGKLADVFSVGTTSASKRFWSNIDNGIYLLKIESQFEDPKKRSRQGFREARSLASSAMVSQPFDFYRKILATLSPANTSICPAHREHILGYLAEEAGTLFTSRHPIRELCNALNQDGGDSHVPASALFALQGLLNETFGPSNSASHKLTDTIISLMRRMGDTERAQIFAEAAFELARSDHGRGSMQARKAAVELSHILTKRGRHDLTLPLLQEVVTEPAQDADRISAATRFEPIYRKDEIAIYAMEDIAEYHVRVQDVAQAVLWLSRARIFALELWGDSVSTSHICDKLENLLRNDLRGQVIDEKGRLYLAA